jgi:uncharacterized protein (UPF0335 family)
MNIAKEQLLSIVVRVEALTVEKKAIQDDIKEVYAEAKSSGFDTKALRQIIKMRSMDVSERQNQEFLLETYAKALGLLPELEGAS